MKGKYLLRVQYRLRAHDMASFEKILISQVVPLAEELGLKLTGVWRSFIGNAGEYIEHWEFDSMNDLEEGWKRMIDHPELQNIFETTGPMVEEENFTVYEPIWRK